MPCPMLHLSVAKSLLDVGFVVDDAAQFYLGALAPDAMHMREGVERAYKRTTHLMPDGSFWADIDEDEFCAFVLRFAERNRDRTNADFLRGYLVHILTDMYWIHRIYPAFLSAYEADPAPLAGEKPAYYNDTDNIEFLLFDACPWKDDVWRQLLAARGADFLDLLAGREIDAWRDHVDRWFHDPQKRELDPIRYIRREDAEAFVATAAEAIVMAVGKRIG